MWLAPPLGAGRPRCTNELEDLLPAGDEAGAEHVVDAKGLGGGRRRRGGVVRRVGELLLQLQVVQNQPVAIVGDAQAVRVVGGGGKVGADPGSAQFSVPSAASTQ